MLKTKKICGNPVKNKSGLFFLNSLKTPNKEICGNNVKNKVENIYFIIMWQPC